MNDEYTNENDYKSDRYEVNETIKHSDGTQTEVTHRGPMDDVPVKNININNPNEYDEKNDDVVFYTELEPTNSEKLNDIPNNDFNNYEAKVVDKEMDVFRVPGKSARL